MRWLFLTLRILRTIRAMESGTLLRLLARRRAMRISRRLIRRAIR